jgi:DNA-directed RNA polymerase subunit RPC12/RpoP
MTVPQMRIGPLLQYFCSTCGKVLKETPSLDLQYDQLKEECPSCGSLLVETLQNRRLSLSLLQQNPVVNTVRKPAEGLSSDFQIAYQQVESNAIRLAFDIEKLDSLLNLSAQGSLCIIGEQMYTQLLMDRLCVHSMLPKRHGGIGLGYSKIIAIDAGNCSDVYQIVNFARQYGLGVKGVLKNIIVSRVFTIYQLAHLVVNELPRIIEQLSSDRKYNVIVIYGLLHSFVSDPHIDKADAKQLVKEIAASMKKISEDRFVVVSTTHCNRKFEKLLLPLFDNVIRIVNDIENNEVLQVNVHNQNHHIGGKGIRSAISTKLCKQELLLVPLR